MPARTWTDAELALAVASSTRWRQVCVALGVTTGGRAYETLRRHAARLELDTTHLPGTFERRPLRERRFNDEELRAAVCESASYAEVMRRLDYAPSGGMHRYIKGHIKRLGLDTSHFVGQAWAKGSRNTNGFVARPLEEVLVNGSKVQGARLLRRLIAEGLMAARCQHCGRAQWRCRPIPLELDHVNGDPTDNRLENLRVLCPNCHAQTHTYCGRNRKPA
jgi:Zn finger protein HypA/HybF involved in hydrogenase expression